MAKFFIIASLLLTFFASCAQTMDDRGKWFEKQHITHIGNYKVFDKALSAEQSAGEYFLIFKGAIYNQSLKNFLEISGLNCEKIILEMIEKEEKICSMHPDLGKDNFAQCRFFAIYKDGKPESFSIPAFADSKEREDAFYANGTVGTFASGFVHNDVKKYPWIFKSIKDNSLLLVQRPSSTPEATERTVRLLERLAQDPEIPNTLSLHVLKELHRGFDGFKASKDQIRDELYGHLADRASSLDEETLGFLKGCIAQSRFDLEGRFFEIEKKEQEIILKKQIDELKKSLFPNLEELQNSHKQTTSNLAALEKKLKEASDADGEKLRKQLESQKKKEQAEIGKIHKKSHENQQVKSLEDKRKKIVTELDGLRDVYQSAIKKLHFENICNPKDFNFGCSEQLLIDHVFRAALDETIVSVSDKINGRHLDALILMIHSTMTPCKTCSLDIALEMFHEEGRIFKFFNALAEDLGSKDFKKIAIVSFGKEYCPTEQNKLYGFAFSKGISASPDFYWLVDGSH